MRRKLCRMILILSPRVLRPARRLHPAVGVPPLGAVGRTGRVGARRGLGCWLKLLRCAAAPLREWVLVRHRADARLVRAVLQIRWLHFELIRAGADR